MTFGLSGAAIAGLAIGGATVYGATKSASAARDAATTAANAQTQSAQLGIDEQHRQFDSIQKLLSPFVTAGTGALGAQQDLLGLNGAPAQKTAIDAIKASPEFQALSQQGQEAILANASATGGLRGGNVQGSLAQFQPTLLAQLINQQYGRLGGLAQMGQASAAGVGSAGMATGDAVTKLLGQQGSAAAGAALAGGKADALTAASIPNSLLTGLGVFKGLGGSMNNSGAVENTLF
jgi:hypothetical protein